VQQLRQQQRQHRQQQQQGLPLQREWQKLQQGSSGSRNDSDTGSGGDGGSTSSGSNGSLSSGNATPSYLFFNLIFLNFSIYI